MLDAYPPRSPGRVFGLGLLTAIILIDACAVILLIRLPITIYSFLLGLLLFISFPCLFWVAFLTASLSTARYHIVANTLVIEWGRLRQVIGLNQISALRLGTETIKVPRFRGTRWPGLMFGRSLSSIDSQPLGDEPEITAEGEEAGNGRLQATYFFATRPISQQLLVSAGLITYAISPPDPAGFKNDLDELRSEYNPKPISEPAQADWGFLGWDIWQDRILGICLGAALLLNTSLFGLLTILIGRLPAEIPLHFDAQGLVDRFGSPADLFLLPVVGLIALLTTCALAWFYYQHRREKPLAYLVCGAAVILEMATWVGLVGLLTSA